MSREPKEDNGMRMLVGVMLWVGAVIFIFGMVTALDPSPSRRITGAIIMAIGVFDWLMCWAATKWLPKLNLGP